MWTEWKASTLTPNGDDVKVRYRDAFAPTGYQLEFTHLELNGSHFNTHDVIEELLSECISTYELRNLFNNAVKVQHG